MTGWTKWLAPIGCAICVAAIATLADVHIEVSDEGDVTVTGPKDRIKVVREEDDQAAPGQSGNEGDGSDTIETPPAPPWEPKVFDLPRGKNGYAAVNIIGHVADIKIHDTLFHSGEVSVLVQQNDRFHPVRSIEIKNVVAEYPAKHGAFLKDVRKIEIDGLVVDRRDRGKGEDAFDNFLQGIYIRPNRKDMRTSVVIRNAAFYNCPHYGIKFRSDYNHGFEKIVVENCLFVDCPEPLGFKPNPVDKKLAELPQENVIIRNCVFVQTSEFRYPDDWGARKLVRLYAAGELTFTGNISMGTEKRADQPRDAIAHADWPENAIIENNHHIDEAPIFELPMNPHAVKPTLDALRKWAKKKD